ncbi:hypothetical protein CC85DRAFT_327632 [Cutaneotrichosporon oleaginosum]|uniref:LigT-like protein n=1 Tax=Cutaneotrichosporon oleaginosum TaxID=879819 RepID=A0A0J0XPR2_9TREE|nr:uncharacterized protein CC85DRAFT_327632 [Cutaneotrichosporon oleaginosum]KLT43116.1 hypothetical protein CC85DRAFT_327632 [Cutaneotrichosporon oleaginosum]TXT10044.1 hypothetical protein COLE_03978 [Cutaneotrichosporon oleaginosum]
MLEKLKAGLAERQQEKLERAAPAGAADQAHALQGYCLWLLPPLEHAKTLRELVFSLSKGAGSPAFMPHITLLSPRVARDPDALETALHHGVNASMLARDMQSDEPGVRRGDAGWLNRDPEAYDRAGEAAEPGIKLRLGPPQVGDAYYQCVLSPVDPASAASLVALRTAIAERLGESALPYFPHLSLCYGDFEEGKRQEIAASAAQSAQWPIEISCTEAAVVDINGTADQWRIVTTVRLT